MRQDMNMDEIMEYQGRLYFMPRKEIKRRTEELLEFCDLIKFRKRTVRKLSGGMKRKLMVCRALLTDPEILLLDEPTAGMDALSRRQMWNLLRKLNGKNLTILLTTHYMEEAAQADRVVVIDSGEIVMDNEPEKIFSQVDTMRNLGLDVPQVTQLANGLKKAGHSISAEIITEDECVEALAEILANKTK